jgi:hypothetical protein
VGNYKITFINEVEKLLAEGLELKEGIKEIDVLLEAYVSQVGEVPDSQQLTRLANFILQEELKYKHPDKVTKTEFPFLGKRQLITRSKREIATDLSNKSFDPEKQIKKRHKFYCQNGYGNSWNEYMK